MREYEDEDLWKVKRTFFWQCLVEKMISLYAVGTSFEWQWEASCCQVTWVGILGWIDGNAEML